MNANDLEKLCMGFKGTTQDIKWENDLCYLVGNKMFCVTSLHGFQYVSFKAAEEDFNDLTERNGIVPAPYSAKHFWVLVRDPIALRPNEWSTYIARSYQLIYDKLPKKIKAKL